MSNTMSSADAFNFIVHDPSGIIECTREISLFSRCFMYRINFVSDRYLWKIWMRKWHYENSIRYLSKTSAVRKRLCRAKLPKSRGLIVVSFFEENLSFIIERNLDRYLTDFLLSTLNIHFRSATSLSFIVSSNDIPIYDE